MRQSRRDILVVDSEEDGSLVQYFVMQEVMQHGVRDTVAFGPENNFAFDSNRRGKRTKTAESRFKG
jgi:hypothetical protein